MASRDPLWQVLLPSKSRTSDPQSLPAQNPVTRRKPVKTYFASLDAETPVIPVPGTTRPPFPPQTSIPRTAPVPSLGSMPSMSRKTSFSSTRSFSSESLMNDKPSLKRVRVAVRCRPPIHESDFSVSGESDEGKSIEESPHYFETPEFQSAVKIQVAENRKDSMIDSNDFRGRVLVQGDGFEKAKSFHFDHVFGPQSQQHEVYTTVAKPVVTEVLKGYNGAILAYGQTGTGKTHTMGILDRVTQTNHDGIIPGCLRQIFQEISTFPCEKNCGCSWSVSLSFLQIYLETLQDLLAPLDGGRVEENLLMREDPKSGFYVQGLRRFTVRSYSEAISLINLALENRRMASTSMNDSSSRSHTVLTVAVEMLPCGRSTHFSTDFESVRTTKVEAKLRLVDLAGSERVKTNRSAAKAQVTEARSINVSLSALGNVVAALASREDKVNVSSVSSVASETSDSTIGAPSHVPYRDSKLTKLLQDTLGGKGGCNTVLVATVGPSQGCVRETISTLKFASRCMRVRSEVRARHELNPADLCVSLQHKLASVEQQFCQREEHIRQTYEQEILYLKQEISRVRVSGNWNEGHGNESNNESSQLLYDMYQQFMHLARDFRQRLDQQRRTLENFVKTEFPNRVDAQPNESGPQVFTPPTSIANVKAALEPYSSPHSDAETIKIVAKALNCKESDIHPAFLRPVPLNRDSKNKDFALHAKVMSKVFQLEAEAAHELLNRLMDELITLYVNGAKRDEDLLNCSQVLKYLLKTNSDLRLEMQSVSSQHQRTTSRSTSPSLLSFEEDPVIDTEAKSARSGSSDDQSQQSSMSQLDVFLLRKRGKSLK